MPGACSGELIGGMCMSEPGAGTDVLGMGTVAKKDGDHYVLDGQKMWITNGAISDTDLGDVFLVYAKHEERSERAISLFLVEKGMDGFSLGQKIKGKLGMRASTTAELVFEGVRVGAGAVLGVLMTQQYQPDTTNYPKVSLEAKEAKNVVTTAAFTPLPKEEEEKVEVAEAKPAKSTRRSRRKSSSRKSSSRKPSKSKSKSKKKKIDLSLDDGDLFGGGF